MRNFDAKIWRELQKARLHHFFALEFQFSSTQRITETDIDVWYDGDRFSSRGFKFDSISSSSNLSVENLDIELDDTDQLFSAIFLSEDVRNAPAILYHGVIAEKYVYTGSVTLANMKISAIDGTAFIDFGTSKILTAYAGGYAKLTITDSAGKSIVGYIKAAGTGETYGSNTITNGDMESLTGWSTATATVTANTSDYHGGSQSAQLELTSSNGYLYRAPVTSVGVLYSISYWVKNLTTAVINSYVYYESGKARYLGSGTASTSWINLSGYYTANYANGVFAFVMTNASGKIGLADDLTIKQVLTPSATGVTIVSEMDGATYNWTSKDASFNYNDSSGYTYKIENLGVSDPVGVDYSYIEKEVVIEEFQRYIVGGWELYDDNVAKITLTNELVLWNRKPLRTQSASCQWAFKGTECGYAGAETVCNKSYGRCYDLGNTPNFSGNRFLPELMETTLWWGRTPNYKE